MISLRYLIPVLLFAGMSVLTGCTHLQRTAGSVNLAKQISAQKGLVAFWNFTDTSGYPAAGSASEVRLQAFGSAKFVRDEKGVFSGWSMNLDGNSYWSVKHENSGRLDIKTNAVTVIAWVKWYGGMSFVAGKWNEYSDGGKRQYGLFVSLPYYNGEDQVCGHISKNGGPTVPFPYSIDYSASTQKVPANQWVCVAFTYDGKYIRSYLNGKFEVRKPELIMHTAGFMENHPNGLTQVKNPYYYPDGMGNNGSDFTVGAVQLKQGMGNFFKGKIGGIAVFDRALSNKEMKRLAIVL